MKALAALLCLIWFPAHAQVTPACAGSGQALTGDPVIGFKCSTLAIPAQKSWMYPSTGTAASGFSIVIPDGITAVAINAPTLLLAGNLTLPVNPADGQPVTINCPKGITALTLTPNTGQSVSNSFLPSTCAVNTPIRVKYYAINSTWYPN